MAEHWSDADVRALATAVCDELGGSVISSAIPAAIGDWIAQQAEHGTRSIRHLIYGSESTCLITDWYLELDRTLRLELLDTNGCSFWRGRFVPIPA